LREIRQGHTPDTGLRFFTVYTKATPADDLVEGAIGTFDQLPASTNMDSAAT